MQKKGKATVNSDHADATDPRDVRRELLPLWIKLFSRKGVTEGSEMSLSWNASE